MLEWYEAYADFRDTMDRIEAMLEQVALEALGTTVVAVSRARDRPEAAVEAGRLRRVARGARSSGRATRRELRALARRSAASTPRPTRTGRSSSTTRSATSSSRASSSRRSCTATRSSSRRSRASTDDDDDDHRAVRVLRGGDGARQRVHGDQRRREQQRRFDEQSAHVEGVRGDPDYVEALSYGMPPTGGLGLGIDRLVMLLSGRETIRDVILFPALRPDGR